jgi:hypothetical protein
MNKNNFIGDCRDESLVEEIFGSVSEFARQVELEGNEFVYGNVKITYNSSTDIHKFFTIK